MDSRSEAVLQEIVRRQSRSLLQYVGEAFPWTKSNGKDVLATFRRLFQENTRSVTSLGEFLGRRRVTLPHLGAFPNWYTTINFVSLDYLLPQLVEAERKEVADLERDLGALEDEDARTQVLGVLETKRRHLRELESLVAGRAAAVPS